MWLVKKPQQKLKALSAMLRFKCDHTAFFFFLFLIELGLGSPRGPVELGYPMARAQRRRDLLCFLFTGSDPPARTSTPAEVRAGRAGLDPVRGNNSVLSKQTTLWCTLAIGLFFLEWVCGRSWSYVCVFSFFLPATTSCRAWLLFSTASSVLGGCCLPWKERPSPSCKLLALKHLEILKP